MEKFTQKYNCCHHVVSKLYDFICFVETKKVVAFSVHLLSSLIEIVKLQMLKKWIQKHYTSDYLNFWLNRLF